MVKPIGGRGHKAPYKTTVIRVPVELVDTIDHFCDQYRISLERSKDKDFLGESTLEHESLNTDLTPDQAVEKAREILSQKKSAKVSLKKMLQVVYGEKLDSTVIDKV
jgi:hypothetical protein